MLRMTHARWSRVAAVLALGAYVIGASCATPADPPAPVSGPGAESMESPHAEVRSVQEQADIVGKLKFDTALLEENVKQARLYEAEHPPEYPRAARGTIKHLIES